MLPLSTADAMQVDAWFSIQSDGNRLHVTPCVRSSETINIRYQLDTQKVGRSGSTRNRQSGQTELVAHLSTALSQLILSRDSSDRYHFLLRIYHADRLLAEQQVDFPPD